MAKRRITDIARERGLDPNEVAARLHEAGVAIRGDLVDEAAAARALAGSRPTGAGAKTAQATAPVRTATRKPPPPPPAPPAHPQAMAPPPPPRPPVERPARPARPDAARPA